MQGALGYYPELIGKTFQDVCFSFDGSTPLGIVNVRSNTVILCPRLDYVMEPHDEIMLMRQRGSLPLQPRPAPFVVEDDWTPPCSPADFAKLVHDTNSLACDVNSQSGEGQRAQTLRIGTSGKQL